MNYFHKNFPFGKSVWIWELNSIFAKDTKGNPIVDYAPIIKKCKDNDVSCIFVKSGDGGNTWPQWNQELVDAFHQAGIKIYSWSFVYGADPLREAAIAMWSLDMGADGHIFDAEDQFEKVSDPAVAAEILLQAVRGHAPSAFLAYSPEPIIDYHTAFPYIQFGKYCDAVLPQIYFGEWNKSPADAINWVYDNWSRWQETWKNNGHADSIKPLVPTCQAYDWTSTVQGIPDYVLKPEDILNFCEAAKGYKAVSFYEYAHIVRADCWNAIKYAAVNAPTNTDLGLEEAPATQTAKNSAQDQQPTAPASQPAAENKPADSSIPANSSDSTSPASVVLQPDSKIVVTSPTNGKVSVTPVENPADPSTIDIHIEHQSPIEQRVAIDYIIDFFMLIRSIFTRKRKGVFE